MKRTWITVKRGILEPKHRFALGELIWLFIYILDRTNWEEGVIEEWLDRGAAEEMEMPVETLRDQRRKLETKGYITCERKQRGIRIIVHNWTNPKEYTGKVYNVKIPSDTPSCTPDCTPSFNDPSQNNVSSYSQKSKIINHNILPEKESGKPEPILEPCNEDGLPDSWRESKPKNKVNIKPDQQRLANTISGLLGIKTPICNNRKDYAAMQVTWWKPITEMLRQVDGDIEKAERIVDDVITAYRAANLTMNSPKSLLNGFIGELVNHNKPRKIVGKTQSGEVIYE